MPDYSPFTASETAAFWPLNTPWWRKMRDNAVYARRIQFMGRTFGTVNVTEGSGQDGVYQTWVPNQVKILQCVNDDNANGNNLGVTAAVAVQWETSNDANVTASTTILRLSAFGETDTDTIVNVGAGSTANSEAVLTVTGAATVDALSGINLELNVDVTGATGITTVIALNERYWLLHAATS